jgi:hypothetical protein
MDFQTLPGTADQRTTSPANPALRRAFVTIDNWLIGQEWTNFQNTAVLPESADFIGAAEGTVFARQVQVRYTRGPFSVSVENPETTVTPFGGGARIIADDNSLPVFNARYAMARPWGDMQFAGLLRQMKYQNPSTSIDSTATGWGLSASTKIKVGAKDDLRLMLTGGEGIGRYVGLNFSNDAVLDASGDLEAIAAHRAAGKRAVFVRDGKVVLATGPTELALADVSAIPLTYDGRVPFQLENVLAAVATGWALGISNDLMRAGIMTFDVGQVDVPGRFTLFQHHGATIVVDDAHNASALEALAAALDNFPAQRRTLVFGAGLQRRDEDLVAQGTVIGQTFDRVLLCEDASVKRTDAEFDRQARALLKQGLQAGGRVAEVVVEGAKRRDVVDAALSQVTAGDLLVLQCDECAIEGTVQQVHQWMGRAESQN